MPIKLKNKTRSPRVLEAPSLGQETLRVVRATPQGRSESEATHPLSVFIPGRGQSDALPDAVEYDPEVSAAIKGGVIAVVKAAAPPAPKEQ